MLHSSGTYYDDYGDDYCDVIVRGNDGTVVAGMTVEWLSCHSGGNHNGVKVGRVEGCVKENGLQCMWGSSEQRCLCAVSRVSC